MFSSYFTGCSFSVSSAGSYSLTSQCCLSLPAVLFTITPLVILLNFIGINTIFTLTPQFIAPAPASSLNSDLTVYSTPAGYLKHTSNRTHANLRVSSPNPILLFPLLFLISECNAIFPVFYPQILTAYLDSLLQSPSAKHVPLAFKI